MSEGIPPISDTLRQLVEQAQGELERLEAMRNEHLAKARQLESEIQQIQKLAKVARGEKLGPGRPPKTRLRGSGNGEQAAAEERPGRSGNDWTVSDKTLEKARAYVEEHFVDKEFIARDLAKGIGTATETANRACHRMRESGIIVLARQGANRSRVYRLVHVPHPELNGGTRGEPQPAA